MKSNNKQFELRTKTQLFADTLFFGRNGEERIGDVLNKSFNNPQFLILGISEAIGPFANYGRVGAELAFSAFLDFFLSTPYQNQSVDIIGNIVFIGSEPEDVHAASALVEELDEFVLNILTEFVGTNQVPILIGGGHNNALPAMRWANQFKNCNTVINVDAHTDCRKPNRRHSGNSFSFALQEGVIKNYHAIGIHEFSITPFMKSFLSEYAVNFTTFESYFTGRENLLDDISNICSKSEENIGLEIDLDSIANMPSSASSPSGWNLDEIRMLVRSFNPNQTAYLNLTEGAVYDAKDRRTLGKALNYLCLDFIRVRE